MGPKTIWHVNQNTCQLDDQQFKTSLQLDKPSFGLINTQIHGKPLANCQLLKIIQQNEAESVEIADCFVRGSDLVVTFVDHKERSVQPQVYWRYSRFEESAFLVDVVISVETSLLECNPTISVQSVVENAKLFQMDEQGLHPVDLNAQESMDCRSGVAIFRFADSNISFMTAVHSTDFESMRIEKRNVGDAEQTVLNLVLFQHELEKGVIRRGRVRGAFIPTDRDLEFAKQPRENFELQPPPLTT